MYSFSLKSTCNQAHVKLVKEFNYQNLMQQQHRNRCPKKTKKKKTNKKNNKTKQNGVEPFQSGDF